MRFDLSDEQEMVRGAVRQFIDNFAQFEDHVDEGVRKAAPVAA